MTNTYIKENMQQKREFVFAFYETISRKRKKSKANDWVTEKSEAHNTQDQEKGVGEPAKAEARQQRDKTSSRKELSDTKPSKQ